MATKLMLVLGNIYRGISAAQPIMLLLIAISVLYMAIFKTQPVYIRGGGVEVEAYGSGLPVSISEYPFRVKVDGGFLDGVHGNVDVEVKNITPIDVKAN